MRWRLRLRTTWDEICCFFVHKEHWTGLEFSIHFSLLLRRPIAPCTLWMTCRYTHFLGGICTGDFRCTRFSIRLWLWPWNNSRSLAFKSQTYDFAKSNVRAQKLKKSFVVTWWYFILVPSFILWESTWVPRRISSPDGHIVQQAEALGAFGIIQQVLQAAVSGKTSTVDIFAAFLRHENDENEFMTCKNGWMTLAKPSRFCHFEIVCSPCGMNRISFFCNQRRSTGSFTYSFGGGMNTCFF